MNDAANLTDTLLAFTKSAHQCGITEARPAERGSPLFPRGILGPVECPS